MDDKLETFVEKQIVQQLRSDEEYDRLSTDIISAKELKERDLNDLRSRYLSQDSWDALHQGFRLMIDRVPEFIQDEEMKDIASQELANMGLSLASKCRKQASAANFQELLGLSDQTVQAGYLIGMDLISKEAWEDAQALFGLLVSLNGRVSMYWVGYARALYGSGNGEAALELLHVATALNPQSPVPYFFSAQVHASLENFEEAEHELNNLESVTTEDLWRSAAHAVRSVLKGEDDG